MTGNFVVLDNAGTPTGVDARVDAVLAGTSLDLLIRLHNNALSTREFSLTWQPHFAAPGGDLSNWQLTIPSTDVAVSPRTRSVAGSLDDFSNKAGRQVPNTNVDNTYVNLEHLDIGNGPEVLLTDRLSGFILRAVLISPSLRSVRLRTDTAAHTLLLGFGTRDANGGTMLAAGESVEWHIQLELLPLDKSTGTSK